MVIIGDHELQCSCFQTCHVDSLAGIKAQADSLRKDKVLKSRYFGQSLKYFYILGKNYFCENGLSVRTDMDIVECIGMAEDADSDAVGDLVFPARDNTSESRSLWARGLMKYPVSIVTLFSASITLTTTS